MRFEGRFVIETHAHITTIYTPKGKPTEDWTGLPLAPEEGEVEYYDNSALCLYDMERYGVDMCVLKPSVTGTTNEKLKELKADTIEELAGKAGIDPKGLKETLEKYNGDLERFGYDTVFGRNTLCGVFGKPIKINTPPFYANKTMTSLTSVKGGLKVNAKCQVINQFGEVIPGLYAIGELIGGFA